ncbi:helix-turn-helix domain-containing protein [Actinokineospora bangkokensis]|uniref:HTH cro/C1-type domain-containing protein n=1 Tax=Actinokineospora bangkokensis TaxID=1193682 RepID=A0A1Q9LD33_9PSEU|nr:helix-turn-helix transcriptional regulator [Actinokineospora bangkokensis]OLR89916.1 hypothetical protein BJP25_02645 [Actinokineospora bangkokensis]
MPAARVPEPQLDELSRVIAAAREDRGWSVVGAAQEADVSKSAWQNLERGRRLDGKPFKPTEDLVVAVAEALELDPARLLRLAGVVPGRPRGRGRRVGPASPKDIERLAGRLTARQRAAVAELMRSFVEPEDGEVAEQARSGVAEAAERSE